MNEQQLEYVRIQLRAALVDNSGKTKGQLQAFGEHPPADEDRNPRKPVHMVELEDGRGGVRTVKAQNSALYVLETRSRRRPMPPINDYEFAASPWRRAVNILPEHQQAWLRYCYGFDLTFRYQTLICEAVWNAHQQYLPTGLLRKTQKRLVSLVWLAAQEVAAMRSNHTYKKYAGAALGQLVGTTRQGWSKTYAAHWKELKRAFIELDEITLMAVMLRHSSFQSEEVD